MIRWTGGEWVQYLRQPVDAKEMVNATQRNGKAAEVCGKRSIGFPPFEVSVRADGR